jgi:hypothetical protein
VTAVIRGPSLKQRLPDADGQQVDAQLVALARAAEEGEQCPPVRVLAGNQLFLGQPKASSVVFDNVYAEALAQARRTLDRRSRSEKKADPGDPDALAAPFLDPLRESLTASGEDGVPTALTLAPAQWWPMAGDGLAVPVLRIPLNAVDAWWVVHGNVLKAGSSRTWFVGAIFPLNL